MLTKSNKILIGVYAVLSVILSAANKSPELILLIPGFIYLGIISNLFNHWRGRGKGNLILMISIFQISYIAECLMIWYYTNHHYLNMSFAIRAVVDVTQSILYFFIGILMDNTPPKDRNFDKVGQKGKELLEKIINVHGTKPQLSPYTIKKNV